MLSLKGRIPVARASLDLTAQDIGFVLSVVAAAKSSGSASQSLGGRAVNDACTGSCPKNSDSEFFPKVPNGSQTERLDAAVLPG